MSLWTPSGEHRVGAGRSGDAPTEDPGHGAGDSGAARGPTGPVGSRGSGGGADAPDDAGLDPTGQGPDGALGAEDLESLRRQLAETPAEVVVANHCYGLFELAALHLSGSPPGLEQARLAIDALGFLVDGLGERLGAAYPELRDALAQIRLAYVQISSAEEHRGGGVGNGVEADQI